MVHLDAILIYFSIITYKDKKKKHRAATRCSAERQKHETLYNVISTKLIVSHPCFVCNRKFVFRKVKKRSLF